ncbi:hypothetical protein [Nocardia asteroides]
MSTDTRTPDDTAADTSESAPAAVAPSSSPPRTIAIRLSTVCTGATLALLLAATATLAVLYGSTKADLSANERRADDDAHAERIAGDYALGASTIDYRDVQAWLGKLKTGTSPQLSAKFDATAPQLEQILLPLQWTSTATPLSADVLSETAGVYKVNAYLTVNSTSVQNPAGTRTTVAYSLTIDRDAGWRITDVGGLQNAVPVK